jgi:hypothetical protein
MDTSDKGWDNKVKFKVMVMKIIRLKSFSYEYK